MGPDRGVGIQVITQAERAAATVNIRPETPTDLADITRVILAAFADHPHSQHTEHLIVDALREAGALRTSLVAELDAEVIGHVALSPVTIGDGSHGWYGLGPVAVTPRWQRRGIGSRLVRLALATLADQGAAGCVVLGDPAYYAIFGFRTDPEIVLDGVPQEHFLTLTLRGPLPRGEVRYHPAFAARG